VGYRELFDHFDGLLSLPAAVELIKQHKEKLSELRNSTVTAENMLKSLVKAADELKGPLEAAKQKAGDLEASVKDFDMDVMSLRNQLSV
jgi:chromosome segregation ATPase